MHTLTHNIYISLLFLLKCYSGGLVWFGLAVLTSNLCAQNTLVMSNHFRFVFNLLFFFFLQLGFVFIFFSFQYLFHSRVVAAIVIIIVVARNILIKYDFITKPLSNCRYLLRWSSVFCCYFLSIDLIGITYTYT